MGQYLNQRGQVYCGKLDLSSLFFKKIKTFLRMASCAVSSKSFLHPDTLLQLLQHRGDILHHAGRNPQGCSFHRAARGLVAPQAQCRGAGPEQTATYARGAHGRPETAHTTPRAFWGRGRSLTNRSARFPCGGCGGPGPGAPRLPAVMRPGQTRPNKHPPSPRGADGFTKREGCTR